MKQFITWLSVTTTFAVGAAANHLLLGAQLSYPLIIGFSLGFGLCFIYTHLVKIKN